MASLQPHWRPTRLALRLASVAVLGLGLAIVLARPSLVAVAAPSLLALAWGGYRLRPRQLIVTGRESAARLYEGDQIDVELEVAADQGELGTVAVHAQLPGAMTVERLDRTDAASSDHAGGHRDGQMQTWRVTANRWGRWTLGPWQLVLTAPGLLLRSTHNLSLPVVAVFPRPPTVQAVPLPPRLLTQLGTHVSRRRGSGTEFATVRPYAPGDAYRRVNWRVTQRRQELFVNDFHAERTSDVVALVDTTVDIGTGEESSLDASVRAAVAVTNAYLKFTDRVGVVGFGGFIRWLTPSSGTRHYYRVVDTLMASQRDDSVLEPDLGRLPRQAIPSGALVYCFTPMLDARVIEALRDLRERGHAVVVFDTLLARPAVTDARTRVARRLWEAERAAQEVELTAMGIIVQAYVDDLAVPLTTVASALRRLGDRS